MRVRPGPGRSAPRLLPHLWGSALQAPRPSGPPARPEQAAFPPARPRAARPAGCGGAGPGSESEIQRPGWGQGRANLLSCRAPPAPRRPPQQGRLSGGGKGHKSGHKKKKFLHIFKTHVALSEVLFILTKSGGTCPHSGEADGTINHRRRGLPAVHSPQLSLFCLFGFR